jgi:hypothetical protein
VRRYWLDASVNDPLGSVMDTSNALINGRLFFPPAQLDAFVLLGNGPNGNDGGLLSVGPPGTPGTDYDAHYTYYMTALRIAFLATRDLDGDEKKDFSYEDRKQANVQHILPDGTNGGGPLHSRRPVDTPNPSIRLSFGRSSDLPIFFQPAAARIPDVRRLH